MIYFDNASTTRVDSHILDEYNKAVECFFANPNSIHHFGMQVNNLLDKERNNILNSLNLSKNDYEIIFTSSATESNNLAIKGYCLKNMSRGKHIITTKIEHDSVLECFNFLKNNYGFRVDYLNILPDGKVDINQLQNLIDDQTILISIMPVNNEVGLVLNIDECKRIVKNYPKCVFHIDCAQTLGKIKFNYNLGDMITLSSHKIHGLKSIACLIKKKSISLQEIICGGGQEKGFRSGTQDYPLIHSFSVAISQNLTNFEKNLAKVQLIFKFLNDELSKNDEIIMHTCPNQCPYILNFSLKNKKASVVVEALSNKNIYVSSVSACSSRSEKPSHVLLALNKSLKEASNSIRISFSYDNTLDEAKIFVRELTNIFSIVRS